MILNSTINYYPDSSSKIVRKRPTKVFSKIFQAITLGITSEKEQRQCLTAVCFLQNINKVLRKLDITNIIQLSKDDVIFYIDKSGAKDDLGQAMQDFHWSVSESEANQFNDLYLVLEHEIPGLSVIIEVDIKRRHQIGEAPIVFQCYGLLGRFNEHSYDSKEAHKRNIKQIISDNSFNVYKSEITRKFSEFVSTLSNVVSSELMGRVKIENRELVLRPNTYDHKFSSETSKLLPIYRGYPGFKNLAEYTVSWLEILLEIGYSVDDLHLVDDLGKAFFVFNDDEIGGIKKETLLDLSNSYEFLREEEKSNRENQQNELDDTSSWLDGFDDIAFDSSCSSCSSCGGD